MHREVEGRWGEMSDKCQVYKLNSKLLLKRSAWRVEKLLSLLLLLPPPCFLVNPPCLPYRCFPLVIHAVCPFFCPLAFSTSLSLSLDLISDFPCQLFCWCFLLYFRLTLFCRVYLRAVNSYGCQISFRCLLVGGHSLITAVVTANRLVWPGPESFDTARCLLWVLVDPVTENCLACFM